MGIRYLSSYVSQCNQFESITFEDGVCLVADGLNMLRNLLKESDSQEGGNYDEYHCIFKEFFWTVKRKNINLYLVMDGGKNLDMKLKTIIERKEKKAKKHVFDEKKFRADELPIGQFAKFVFFEVMKEVDVKFVVCDE